MSFEPPFGPIRIPQSAWDREFEEIEPTFRASDGRKLRRFRHRLTGLIGVEDPMDQVFRIEAVQPQPMVIPQGGIFYMDYKYGKQEDE